MNSTIHSLPHPLQQQIGILRTRLNLGVFCSAFAAPLLGILIFYAGLLIYTKMTGQAWADQTWFTLLLIIPAAAVVYYRAKSRDLFFSELEAIEWLDRLKQSDGWLTSAYEHPELAKHPDFLNRLSIPGTELQWRYGFFLRRLAPVLVILAAALILPARVHPPSNPLNAVSILSAASEKLEETSATLTQTERDSFEERLQQLTSRTDSINAESWEAISALEEDLERSARRNQSQDKALAQTANQINDLLSQAQSASSSEAANVIDQQVADMAEQLAKQAMEKASRDGLSSSSMQTSGARIAELAKQLRAKDAPDRKAMQKLRDDLKKQCEGMCSGDKPSSGTSSSNPTGSGGPGGEEEEGPGQLGFRDIDESVAGKSDEKALQNEFLAAEDFTPAGILRVEPKADPGKFEPTTVRNFEDVHGNRVARTRIRPSEQAVVQRYFQEDKR